MRHALRRSLICGGMACMLLGCAPLGRTPSALSSGTMDAPTRELLARARHADIILLGETHDNLAHHALQQRLIEALAADARPAALVMEQFDIGQQSDIDAILTSPRDIGARLDALGKLMPAGWSWPAYRPVVESALRLNMPLRAANLPRESLRPVMRQGLQTLGASEIDRLGLGLGANWTGAMQDSLEKDIADGHCGLLPPPAVAGMASAQRLRDAVMADRLLAALPMRVIGIVGNGHARRDRAVPFYLKARSPQSTVLAVGMLEAERGQEAHGAYDHVVTLPGVVREKNPCDGVTAPGRGR